ncbi:MAG: VOC family protein [Candidatus Dormibacteraeota bacterium]|nr:VOC family protein [Candidatus Dormibacteraeota bacterium]
MTEQTAARVTGVLNVAIPVQDHDRALDFYRNTLGLEVRRDAAFGPGLRWVEVAPAGALTTIALAPLPEGKTGGVDTAIRLGTADAAAAHAELRARGVDVDAELLRLPGVPPMFSLRDPEGNTLYIVEAP